MGFPYQTSPLPQYETDSQIIRRLVWHSDKEMYGPEAS